ncbi:MAG TPA: CocE/NonD family hydrolase, partial [Vicinamibacteria bacterium]
MRLGATLTGTLAAALVAGSTLTGLAADVDLLWAVRVPLRDGVHLNATIFKPAGPDRPLPVIFTLTPYNSDTYYPRARYFAQNGYVFALVDVRGRGNSEGVFLPFENEGRDGYDVVEWLAKQPWCDGKVAMWGGSYAGYDQWATLQNFPPHLATIVPAAAAALGVDFPAQNNVFAPYLMQWATYTSGVTPQPNLFGDAAFWIAKFRELYLSGRPFRELDRMVGNPSPWFQRVLEHPRADDHWRSLRPSAADYGRISIPILTITGHYDDDQYGAMHYYRSHMAHGTAEATRRHFLVVGPWDHAGTRTPSREVGGLSFGP